MEDNLILTIIVTLSAIFVSAAFHEMMHAFTALKLGDDLAYHHGRITLNPLKHIDPFLTIALPLIFLILQQPPILAAKPVPINTARLKGDEWGMALVGLAGPLTNFVLAAVVALPLKMVGPDAGLLTEVLRTFFVVNVSLCVFNLLPIPPLDGSRLLYAVAPRPVQEFMEQIEAMGLFVVFAIVTFGAAVISPVLERATVFIYRLLL